MKSAIHVRGRNGALAGVWYRTYLLGVLEERVVFRGIEEVPALRQGHQEPAEPEL